MKIPFKLPHKIEQRNRVVGFLTGTALAAVFSLIYMTGALNTVGNYDLDLKFRQRQNVHRITANRDFVFLEIDDGTLEWEKTFPDDPIKYNEIIRALGSEGVGALGLMFSFDYSHPFGLKVDADEGAARHEQFAYIAEKVAQNASLKGNMADQVQYLSETLADPAAKSYAKDIAGKLNEMVYSQDLNQISSDLSQISGFLGTVDLSTLAPDREKALNASMAAAKNVYLSYEAKSVLDTPYGLNDLKAGTAKDKFIKMMHNPSGARPEDPDVALVFDAYHNLKPREMEKLLADGGFDAVVTARVKRDLADKKKDTDAFLKQSSPIAFDLPKGLEGAYTEMRHMVPAEPRLGEVAAGMGIGRAEFPVGDGTLRMIAPAVIYDGKIYPHVDLLVAMKYLGVKKKDVEFKRDEIILHNAVHPRTKQKRDIKIPLGPKGTMMINWASLWEDTNAFQHKSFMLVWNKIQQVHYYPLLQKYAAMNAEQLTGLDQAEQDDLSIAKYYCEDMKPADYTAAKKELDDLRGKVVILGRTAVGTAEINPTPLEPRYHYIGLHANAINTIVENQFVHRLNKAAVVGIFFMLAASLGFIGGLIHTKSPTRTALMNFSIMVAVAVVYTLICFYSFVRMNLDIPVIAPLGLIVITFVLVFLYRFFTEEKEKLKMKGMFSTYVNKEVVESLIDNPDLLKLGGQWTDCTVFFSDVAGFTSISESLKPEELVELLNEYLTAMTDIIFSYGGTLDKYIGDAIVAIYGAPIHFPEHALNACLATLDMTKKLADMRVVWKEQGKHELDARCGVNTGKMIAGNMGSTTRFNYTVMGDNVELGEHLESGGKTYGTHMTISEETRRQAGDKILARWMDIIEYGGHDKPFRIFELLGRAENGLDPTFKKGIETFEEAVTLHFNREWDKALEKYNEVYTYIPGDSPTKKAIERCEKAKAENPGAEFDALLANAEPMKLGGDIPTGQHKFE